MDNAASYAINIEKSGPELSPVQVPPATSTNYIAEIAKGLRELKIAITVMRRHPEVLDEYRRAVLGPAKDPAEKPTTPENPRIVQGQHI